MSKAIIIGSMVLLIIILIYIPGSNSGTPNSNGTLNSSGTTPSKIIISTSTAVVPNSDPNNSAPTNPLGLNNAPAPELSGYVSVVNADPSAQSASAQSASTQTQATSAPVIKILTGNNCGGPNPLQYTSLGNYLLPGQTLNSCQAIKSSDGRYILAQQSDGNLVEYDVVTGTPRWDLGKANNKLVYTNNLPNHSIYQTDGNLVTYDSTGNPLWESGTEGKNSSKLLIQQDGNIVIYAGDPIQNGRCWSGNSIWSTSTGTPSTGIFGFSC